MGNKAGKEDTSAADKEAVGDVNTGADGSVCIDDFDLLKVRNSITQYPKAYALFHLRRFIPGPRQG
jgi:hypothetical protein